MSRTGPSLMLTVEPMPGADVWHVILDAIRMADRLGCHVNFQADGVAIQVHRDSIAERVLGHYHAALAHKELRRSYADEA